MGQVDNAKKQIQMCFRKTEQFVSKDIYSTGSIEET